MPPHKFVDTDHGPAVTIQNHGDGHAVIVVTNVKGFVHPESVQVRMNRSEVGHLRDLLDEVLDN